MPSVSIDGRHFSNQKNNAVMVNIQEIALIKPQLTLCSLTVEVPVGTSTSEIKLPKKETLCGKYVAGVYVNRNANAKAYSRRGSKLVEADALDTAHINIMEQQGNIHEALPLSLVSSQQGDGEMFPLHLKDGIVTSDCTVKFNDNTDLNAGDVLELVFFYFDC